VIQVTVNGKAHSFEAPLGSARCFPGSGFPARRSRWRRNGEIVPKSAHAGTMIRDGDQLEIVWSR
jgi:sulfur carrier protein